MKTKKIFRWIVVVWVGLLLHGCDLLTEVQQQPDQADEQAIESEHQQQSPAESREESAIVTDIYMDPTAHVVYPGEDLKLEVILEMSDQTEQPADLQDIRFASDQQDWLEIDDQGIIHLSEAAPIGRTATISAYYKEKEELFAQSNLTVKYSPEETVMASGEGLSVVTNEDSIAVMVNKQRSLPQNYRPEDLLEPNVPFSFNEALEKRLLRKEAAQALEALFAQADEDGITLRAVSGFRSYQTQKSLFNMYVQKHGEDEASRFSAFPGTSEHQTGLAMDVSSPSVGNLLEQSLGDKAEGKWLAEKAHKFGFIIRYPQEKEQITGYMYEPWHLRYVGEEIARDIFEQEITLEEYFEEAVPVVKNKG